VYVIPTYRKLQGEARKAGAEASEIVAQGAVTLLQPLQSRVIELNSEVAHLRGVVAQLEVTLQEERRLSLLKIQELSGQVLERDMRIRMLEARGRDGQSSWGKPQGINDD
jgi:uncharacterized protein (DUF3084 family)